MDVLQKAFRQYESAMGSAAATGDRLCQMEAMDGAARCLEALRLQHKICNCRPLEFNTRLLEVAGSVGAKVNCQYRSRIVTHVRFIYFMWNKEKERYKGREEKSEKSDVLWNQFPSPDVKTWEFSSFLLSSEINRIRNKYSKVSFFVRWFAINRMCWKQS